MLSYNKINYNVTPVSSEHIVSDDLLELYFRLLVIQCTTPVQKYLQIICVDPSQTLASSVLQLLFENLGHFFITLVNIATGAVSLVPVVAYSILAA